MKGTSYLNEPNDETGRNSKRHLHVVISNPDEENIFFVVPICTYRESNGKPFPGIDISCRLPVGCHSFINRESYVSYETAKSKSYTDIFNGIRKGNYIPKDTFSEKYVQDMQKGARKSLHLPEKFKRFFDYFD
jgi:hypothetical protein